MGIEEGLVVEGGEAEVCILGVEAEEEGGHRELH